MGANTLQTKADGAVVTAEDPNQFKTALVTEVVPRNVSGAPEDDSSTLGSTLYRWANSFLKVLTLGNQASGLTIEENAGKFSFKVGGVERVSIDSGGLIGSSLKDGTVTTVKRVPVVFVKSGQLAANTSSTSIQDLAVTPATGTQDCTITTGGRQVKIECQSYTTGGGAQASFDINCSAGQNSAVADVIIYRDATIISTQRYETSFTSTGVIQMRIPASAISFIDEPAAGTYTYKLAVQKIAGNQVQANDIRLTVREL